MKVEELVGRLAVRIKCAESGHSGLLSMYGGKDLDASYTYTPIFIEAVENGVAYYRDKPDGEVSILGAKYRDDNWGPVSERFTPKAWKEAPSEGAEKL